jgi:hypothetical protein
MGVLTVTIIHRSTRRISGILRIRRTAAPSSRRRFAVNLAANRFAPVLAVIAAVATLTALTSPARAQSGTEIYLASLKTKGNTVQIGETRNITNRPGYDNQPFFIEGGAKLLFTSIRDGQADIYQYDINADKVLQITHTPESEYSPTPIPGSTDFSVVRVEADSTQRLWAFSADGSRPRLVLADSGPVGYHAWGTNADQLVLFVLGDPHFLQLVDLRTGLKTRVAKDVGRSLQTIPGRPAISYLEHRGDLWWVQELRLDTGKTRPLIQAVPGSQDCAWTPDGLLLMAKGTTIYACRPDSTEWAKVDHYYGVGTITRMAVSPKGDRIALVADEPAPDEE